MVTLPLATGARVDFVEPWAIRHLRQGVKNSLQSHGEEAVLLHMYHVNEVHDTVPRCPVCYDDVYKSVGDPNCATCFGTSYKDGVSAAKRAWALFTDAEDRETFGRRGFWNPVARTVQTEWSPDLWQRDYIVRVTKWSPDHRVLAIEGIYVLKQVSNESLRTGNFIGQTSVDTIAQRADIQKIAAKMPIHKYAVIGQKFDRWDGAER